MDIKVGDKRREKITFSHDTEDDVTKDCVVIWTGDYFYTVRFSNYGYCESYLHNQTPGMRYETKVGRGKAPRMRHLQHKEVS